MRILLVIGLAAALLAPAHADEPAGQKQPVETDEPPPAQPAPAPSAPTAPETAAPAPTTEPAPAAPAPAAPAPVAAPAAPDEMVTIPNPPKRYALAFAGAAAGCFVLGGILGGVALSREDEQNGNPANPPLYTRDLQDRGSAGKSMATSAYVFFGLGAALAVVDVVLWIETFRKPRSVKRSLAASLTPAGVRF
jgi:hypothetical protein